jgi:16S rRNA (cytosine967-C5)-methyltransferase
MISKSIIFRQHHFEELLKNFDPQKGPIDLFISLYFRHNPQLGSKDRVFVVERIYTYFRWKILLEALQAKGENLFELLEQDLSKYVEDTSLPEHVRVSFPKLLFDVLKGNFGDSVNDVCLSCNEGAPICIRVNPLKTTKENLIQKLKGKEIFVEEIQDVPNALRLARRSNLFSLPEFREGFFEMQDAGSQQVAAYVDVAPGDLVLDYCAGAGGKTLAFGPNMQNKGQIFLHDIRHTALDEAKKRLRRAGIQNIQIIYPEETNKLGRLKGKMNWVLVDVPCSGTGTLRRNPDMKWKFTNEMLSSLVEEQRGIFSNSVQYARSGGKIVYATCSILKEENEEQMAYFLENFPVELSKSPFSSIPSKDRDGFFAVCFTKK